MVIEPETAAAAVGGHQRLLLLDGHSYHCTIEFLDYCLEKHIILGFLLPHITHLLQPLDVGLFGPLTVAYLRLLRVKHGFHTLWSPALSMRDFWNLFWPA